MRATTAARFIVTDTPAVGKRSRPIALPLEGADCRDFTDKLPLAAGARYDRGACSGILADGISAIRRRRSTATRPLERVH